MQSSDDQQDTAVIEGETEAMVNILTPRASDYVILEEVRTTEVGPPAPLCLSEEQTLVSGGIHSKSVSESTENTSLTEKEMSVLDTFEDSGDQGDRKDTAMASSTGAAQVIMVEGSVKQGTLVLGTVPVLSARAYTEKEELPAQTRIEENIFPVHISSEVKQFPALIHIEVEEFPAQKPTKDHEFSIKSHFEEEEALGQTPGKKEELPAQTNTEEKVFLVQMSVGHFPDLIRIEEKETLSQTSDKKEGLPAETPTETQEFLVLTIAMKEELPTQTATEIKDLSAQTHNEIHLGEAGLSAQTLIEEEEFSVEKEEFPSQMYTEDASAQNHNNEHENEDIEEIELPVKEAEGDLVVEEAVAQLSEEDIKERKAHAEEKEFALEEGQRASQASVAPLVEEEYSPDEEDKSAGCENQTLTKKPVSFSDDVESFSHEPRENLRINIYASASSAISHQSYLTAAVQLASPCEEGHVAEQDLQDEVEKINAAGYANSIHVWTQHWETKEEEKSEYGQKDEREVEEVLREERKQEVNTVSATAF